MQFSLGPPVLNFTFIFYLCISVASVVILCEMGASVA